MVFLYKNKKPSINEIVTVRVTEINQFNIVTSLIDYDNLTGYISYPELCRKKRYNLHKIVNIGKDVIVQVIGFNKTKNFAELSVRTLIPSDIVNFTNTHRKYTIIYNLWRYVYMKLNPELNMNLDKINSLEIDNFMENTFWTIEKSLEENLPNVKVNNEDNEVSNIENSENCEKVDLDKLYNILINPSENNSLLIYINKYDIVMIKNILDNYAQIKFISTKQTKFQEFNIYSFDCDGLNNIKKALNYKSFNKWNELMDKYDITILYLTGGKYSLNIKQKIPMEENIHNIYEYLIQEIKTKCELNNLVFAI